MEYPNRRLLSSQLNALPLSHLASENLSIFLVFPVQPAICCTRTKGNVVLLNWLLFPHNRFKFGTSYACWDFSMSYNQHLIGFFFRNYLVSHKNKLTIIYEIKLKPTNLISGHCNHVNNNLTWLTLANVFRTWRRKWNVVFSVIAFSFSLHLKRQTRNQHYILINMTAF